LTKRLRRELVNQHEMADEGCRKNVVTGHNMAGHVKELDLGIQTATMTTLKGPGRLLEEIL